MNIAAIIQARMGSTRLPGKTLMRIKNKSMLAHVIERTNKAKCVNQIIVATTTLTQDDAIIDECSLFDVQVFRGDDINVLDRYYQTANAFGIDIIIRITADCPLLDPDIIDKIYKEFSDSNVDYSSNLLKRTFPRGLDAEAFSFSTLERIWAKASDPKELEHVPLHIFRNLDQFRVLDVVTDDGLDYSDHRWTVDTAEDLKLIRSIYDKLEEHSTSFYDVLTILDDYPELTKTNAHIKHRL